MKLAILALSGRRLSSRVRQLPSWPILPEFLKRSFTVVPKRAVPKTPFGLAHFTVTWNEFESGTFRRVFRTQPDLSFSAFREPVFRFPVNRAAWDLGERCSLVDGAKIAGAVLVCAADFQRLMLPFA
jgi:hypothetical protein